MAMILEAFVFSFAERLVELVKKEVDTFLGVPGEITKLKDELRMINKVLADAERSRINDEAIDDWIKQLKDFMYDADDILDLCRIEADKCSEGSSSTSSVCFPFPLVSCFRKPLVAHEFGTKIRELNMSLEKISRRGFEFSLQISSPNKQEVTSQKSRKTSPVGEIDIVGSEIEEHAQSLVDLLIKDDGRRNILVFAIVGAGGIGKTTLAKRIYNDHMIQEEFSVKKWVCVSQDFDDINSLKDIYDGIKDDLAGDESKSSLEPKVESSLGGKKLFLVLDDVWTAKVWCDLLCNTLKSCAAGSRILVTTRNEQIAMQMSAVKIHHVNKLSLEDGWILLCKKVALTGEEGEMQHLMDISDARKLQKVSDLPSLTTLKVDDCPKLQGMENLQSLKRMKLADREMKSLPSYLLKGVRTAHLEEMEIRCSMELMRNICQSDSLEWQIIQGIQQDVSSNDEAIGDPKGGERYAFGGIDKSWTLPCNISITLLVEGRFSGLVRLHHKPR
ncbi:putative disease resistance protein RGA3 [Cocos nucifera]|uniref:Putative disease resistance protein RGA3 n=1 Tax=Cocos nucifera TaxID=13894 RepID=A0A8K0ICE9_COCNU|nr:putative disease resistance protein RGA3 [Cocos nucifera]